MDSEGSRSQAFLSSLDASVASGVGKKVITLADDVELVPVFCITGLLPRPGMRNVPLVLILVLC